MVLLEALPFDPQTEVWWVFTIACCKDHTETFRIWSSSEDLGIRLQEKIQEDRDHRRFRIKVKDLYRRGRLTVLGAAGQDYEQTILREFARDTLVSLL